MIIRERTASFAELGWLDAAISFLFRLIAKLAEPFLAFGLIASAIDYGSQGHFLGAHHTLMDAWIYTQALALEGSGGIALAMSFDASAEGDRAKTWAQRILALLLLIVGGVLFFVELASAAGALNEAAMPAWYIWSMSAARAIVSLGYIAICRTRPYRWSRCETPTAQSSSPGDEVQRQVELAMQRVADDVQCHIDERIERAVIQALGHARPSTQVYEVQPSGDETQTDPAMPALTAESASLRELVHAFIAEQQAQGHPPSTREIVERFGCAESTARQYRREHTK